MTRVGVVSYPGACDDRDAMHAIGLMGAEPVALWHADADLHGVDAVIVPGGFSYGDYLRPGALAALSPVMAAVAAHASGGRPVLGICNGFQVLTETGLLPGVLMRNASLKFVCRDVHLKVEQPDTLFTSHYRRGEVIRIPIAHGDGNYFADPTTLDELEAEGRVVFRYVDKTGNATADANPNGAQRNIAGICDRSRRILGMMPHPERLFEPRLGGSDGRRMFEGLLATLH